MLERLLNRSARILDSILIIIAFLAGAITLFAGLSDLRKGFVIGACMVCLLIICYRVYSIYRPELIPAQVRRIARDHVRIETKGIPLRFLDISNYELKNKKWYVSGIFSLTSDATHPFELVIDSRSGKTIKWERQTRVDEHD